MYVYVHVLEGAAGVFGGEAKPESAEASAWAMDIRYLSMARVFVYRCRGGMVQPQDAELGRLLFSDQSGSPSMRLCPESHRRKMRVEFARRKANLHRLLVPLQQELMTFYEILNVSQSS